jgi:hypothetical protein
MQVIKLWDSLVNTVMDYVLDKGFDSWQGQDFSLVFSVQIGSRAHPASLKWVWGEVAGAGMKLTTHLHLVPR